MGSVTACALGMACKETMVVCADLSSACHDRTFRVQDRFARRCASEAATTTPRWLPSTWVVLVALALVDAARRLGGLRRRVGLAVGRIC
jgi:hypothetical protein